MKPEQAYRKACNLGKRILKLEPIIIKNVFYSYLYAKDVIKGKWELGEPTISKDARYSFLYALDVIKGRWEKGEPVISKDACYSYCYARDVIKGRLPDFMHNQMILENNRYTKDYVKIIQ